MWFTLKNHDDSPAATLLPIPQSASPKEKWSLISSGRSGPVETAAEASRPSAVSPSIAAGLPLPPALAPKQSAFGLVLTMVSTVLTVFSASTLLPAPTTRRWAVKPLAAAPAASGSDRARARPHAATSLDGMRLGIEPPFPRGLCWLVGEQVSWLPGFGPVAPSRGFCVIPSGWRLGARDLLDPVTVAGPRRFLTGLPLNTDRMDASSLIGWLALGRTRAVAELRPLR